MERGSSPERFAQRPEDEGLRSEELEEALEAIAGLAFLAEAAPHSIVEALRRACDAVSATRDVLAEKSQAIPRRDPLQRDITQARALFDTLYFPLQYMLREFEAIERADPSEQAALIAEHIKEIDALTRTDIEPTLADFRQEPPANNSSFQRTFRRAAAALALFTGTLVALPSPTGSESSNEHHPRSEERLKRPRNASPYAPNMHSNPYEKAENRDAGVFATVDHVRGGIPYFWVSEMYGFSPDGQRVWIDPLPDDPRVGGKVAATVHWKQPLAFRKGDQMNLPVPLGIFNIYTPQERGIELSPSIPFSQHGNFLTAESETDSTTVTYSVYQNDGSRRVEFPRGVWEGDEPAWDFGQDALTLKQELLKHKDPPLPLLRDYLSDFTYITSDTLQSMMSAMPVPWETAVSEVKVGDCDVLSDHVAQVLYSSGYDVGVARGFVEHNYALSYGGAHAKVVYDQEGKQIALETTAYTKDAYQGVDFFPEDARALWTLVRGMHAAVDDPAVLHAALQEFRSTLESILLKPAYEKFENSTMEIQLRAQLDEVLPASEKMFHGDVAKFIRRTLTNPDTGDLKELPLALGAAAGVIALLVSLVYLAHKLAFDVVPPLEASAVMRARREATRDAISKLLKIDLEHLPYQSGKIESAFFALMQELGIPSDAPLTPGEKALVILLDRVRSKKLRNLIFYAFEGRGITEEISNLLQDLAESDEDSAQEHLAAFFRRMYEHPRRTPEEIRRRIEELIPDQMRDIEHWMETQTYPSRDVDLEPRAAKQEPGKDFLPKKVREEHPSPSRRLSSRGHPLPPHESFDFELRDYDPNFDDASMIEWNATARTGRTIVRVRVPERARQEKPKNVIENYFVVDLPGLMSEWHGANDIIIDCLKRRAEKMIIECYAFGQRVATVSPSRLRTLLQSRNGIETLLREIVTLQYRYGPSEDAFQYIRLSSATSDFMNSRGSIVRHLNRARRFGSAITFYPKSEHLQSALV
jgi:hypothetical protein